MFKFLPIADNVQLPDGDVVSRIRIGEAPIANINWSLLIREAAERFFGIKTPKINPKAN